MQNQSGFIVLNKVDQTGIICSGACAVHCLLLPVIAFASPAISKFLHNEWIHIALVITLIPIALFAFGRSLKAHGNSNPAIFGCTGIVLLITAITLESLHIEISNLEQILTGLGSVMLIIGHTLNIKCLRRS